MYGYSQGGDDTTMIIMVMIIFCCSIFCVGIYYYIENEDDDDDDVVDPCNDLTTQTLCSTLPTCTWDTTTFLCRTTPVSPVTCTLEQHVSSKVCVSCPKFGTNLGFSLKSATAAPASGADTACTVKQPCPANWRVNSGSCEACPAGKINDAGDDPTGNDTECQRPACTSTQYMVCHPTPLPTAAQCTFTPGDESTCTSKPGCSYTAPVAASGSVEAVAEACVPDDQCNCVDCPANTSVCSDRISPDASTASTEESSVCQDVCVTGNTPVLSLCPSGNGVPGEGYRVGENGDCIPCDEGKTTFVPHDPNIRNTSCKLPLCEVNEYVAIHTGGVALCTICPTGQANDNQDDPNLMSPTECNQCAENHYVEHTGSTRSCESCGVDDDGEPLVNPIRLDKNTSPPGKEGVCKRRPCYNPGEGVSEGGEKLVCTPSGTGFSLSLIHI